MGTLKEFSFPGRQLNRKRRFPAQTLVLRQRRFLIDLSWSNCARTSRAMGDGQREPLTDFHLFDSLSNKIACLVYSRTDGDKQILNQLLDSLNNLDYNLFVVKNDRGILVVNQCCYLIPPDELYVTRKAVSLFTNLLTKAQIIIKGKTLLLTIDWCLKCLKHGNEVNTLKCLQELARGKGKVIEEDCPQVLTDVRNLSNNFSFVAGKEEICLNCLRCVEAISFSKDEGNDNLPENKVWKYFEIFQSVLYKDYDNVNINEILFCKFVITAMRGLENIILKSSQIIKIELNSILGIVKGFMLYGLPSYSNYKVQKIYPSSTTIPEILKSTQSVKKLKGKYDRRSKKIIVTSINSIDDVDNSNLINEYVGFSEKPHQSSLPSCITSDSDFSDSELNQTTKIKSYEGKVRHCALILLGKIIQRVDPKIFMAYLPNFLPDAASFSNLKTLINCLLDDPSPKCKTEVLGVLITLISNSKQYFLQADGFSKSSFIAFSYNISNIILELHNSLMKTLQSETNCNVIKRTLKCVSDLIRCSPYHKLKSGLITSIANHVKPYLNHKDINIQIFALTVFGCIISVDPKVQEVRDVVINNNQNNKEIGESFLKSKYQACKGTLNDFELCEEEDAEIITEMPWLLKHCLQNLIEKTTWDSSTNAALQIESLQVLGALVRNFLKETLVSFPNEIIHLLQKCSNKSEYNIRLYTGKFMETVFNSLQFSFCQEDEFKTAPVALVTRFWKSLLAGPVKSLIMSQEEPMLRSTGCDCIANVGIQIQNWQKNPVQNNLIFDQLPRDDQILCITLLFGCMRDESPAVRSSAARALAIFVLFPSLRQDSLFFLDAVDAAMLAAKDEHNIVRVQVSWLLGNLSEAIVINNQSKIDDGVNPQVILRLLTTSTTLMRDCPKVKPGAARAIGNILQVIDEDFMKRHKDSINGSIEALIKTATTGSFMKARWNSCYAIGNLLRNPLVHSNNEWMVKIFSSAMSLVQHYKNFKVRISACFILSGPPTRESYGELYLNVWSAVLNALENSKNISDFKEYQHRDQLVDQLCLSLCHLVSMVISSDLKPLQDILYFHLDNLTHFMGKFQERIVPEKSQVLLNAVHQVNMMLEKNCLTTEEKGVIRVLQNVLNKN